MKDRAKIASSDSAAIVEDIVQRRQQLSSFPSYRPSIFAFETLHASKQRKRRLPLPLRARAAPAAAAALLPAPAARRASGGSAAAAAAGSAGDGVAIAAPAAVPVIHELHPSQLLLLLSWPPRASAA
jgi:hypothetical protein